MRSVVTILCALLTGACSGGGDEVAQLSVSRLEVGLMREETGLPITSLKIDGGAAANDRLLQLHADLIGVEVVRPQVLETTALGAAYLAGLAVGFWPSREALRENVKIDRVFMPSMPDSTRDRLIARWRMAVDRVQAWDVS